MLPPGLLTATTRLVAASTLAGLVFWQVAEHAGPRDCVAYVHVVEPRVDVTIDGHEYTIGALKTTPIVRELRPGRHRLRMSRHGRILYEEAFVLRAGQEIVLTAWDKDRLERERACEPESPRSETGL